MLIISIPRIVGSIGVMDKRALETDYNQLTGCALCFTQKWLTVTTQWNQYRAQLLHDAVHCCPNLCVTENFRLSTFCVTVIYCGCIAG